MVENVLRDEDIEILNKPVKPEKYNKNTELPNKRINENRVIFFNLVKFRANLRSYNQKILNSF